MQKVVQDSSGIVGLFNVEQAAQNIYLAMHAIQHRGQDGVGVAVSDRENVVCKKGLGLLSENLKQDTLNSLEGDIAIGQLRMATKNDSQLENVQPIMVRSHQRYFAVVSSGMITNAISLRTKLENEGLIFQGTSDSELLAHLIQLNPGSFEENCESLSYDEWCLYIHGCHKRQFVRSKRSSWYSLFIYCQGR